MPTDKPQAARSRKPAPKAAAKRRPAAEASATEAQPDVQREHAIRQVAYALYEARGCIAGHELEDWLLAEAQVQQGLAELPSRPETAQTSH